MANSETTPVIIKDNDSKTRAGEMQSTCFEQGDRIQRALTRLGLLWLLAGVTLFIPIAHFVLVPGFLIAGPVMAWLTYKVSQQREQVSGT